MKSFEQDNQTIRRFLLGQLPDEQVEQLEDRIFSEPEFAEEVQIVEGELIADQQAGRLTKEESRILAERYNATTANQFNLDYEEAFQKFVCAKRETMEIARMPQPLPAKSQPPPIEHGGFWSQFVLRFGPPTAYATVVIALLILAVVVWFLASRQRSGPDQYAENRKAIEAELARLNSTGALPERILSTVDLEIAHRSGGAMTRVASNTTPDKLFDFRLNLAQTGAKKYRVMVLDDQRRELFAVPNLTAQNSDNAPQIHLLIPVNFLKPGDFQIDLSVANETGGYDQVNSYAFRVTDPRK